MTFCNPDFIALLLVDWQQQGLVAGSSLVAIGLLRSTGLNRPWPTSALLATALAAIWYRVIPCADAISKLYLVIPIGILLYLFSFGPKWLMTGKSTIWDYFEEIGPAKSSIGA